MYCEILVLITQLELVNQLPPSVISLPARFVNTVYHINCSDRIAFQLAIESAYLHPYVLGNKAAAVLHPTSSHWQQFTPYHGTSGQILGVHLFSQSY